MPPRHSLVLRPTQSLAMTARLQQAIKLLQLSQSELEAFVEAELVENPLLERAQDLPDAGAAGDGLEAVQTLAAESGLQQPPDWSDWDENQIEETWSSQDRSAPTIAGEASDWYLEHLPQLDVGLRQHLLEQLRLERLTQRERALAAALIDALDPDGYLRAEPPELAEDLGCPPADLEALIPRLQDLEPSGVFARSLPECFALQLARLDRLDPAMQTLLDHLPLLAEGHWSRLQTLCGVDEDDLTEMVGELRRLDAAPGATFDAPPPESRVPEVLVMRDGAGDWRVSLNPESRIQVSVDGAAYRQLMRRCHTAGEKRYLSEHYQAARWLERSLQRRGDTLLRVGAALVDAQRSFFEQGAAGLRPFTRRELAEELSLHESTVSRAMANKHLSCPRGTFALSYFFTTAIAGAEGDARAAESIRQRIRSLIGAESPDTILSDDALVALLKQDGIEIARRTVAKYRDAMNIPTSRQRRRQARLTG